MASFDKAIGYVLRNEDRSLSGKVTTDSGGRTRFGIAERFHPNLGDDFYTCSATDALALAKDIYYHEYWPCVSGSVIDSDAVAAKLLDMAVNMGVHQAIVLLQRALIVKQDGALGDITLAALNAADPDALLYLLCEHSANFYRHVAAVRPDELKYLDGWLARAKEIPEFEQEVVS